MIVPGARSMVTAAWAAGLILDVVAIVGGLFMYLHHRLTSSHSTAWLAIGLIFVGTFGLTVLGIGVTTSSEGRPSLAAAIVADLVAVVTLLAMVLVAERTRPRVDPAAAGLLLGLVASGVAILVTSFDNDGTLAAELAPWLALAVVVVGTVVAFEVRRLVTLPSWARDRLALAVAALFLGRAALATSLSESLTAHLVSAASSTLAAVLLLGTSLATLRLAIHDDRVVIAALQDQLAATAANARDDRERLHEVKGTIAGIASASRLIHHDPPLPTTSRELLEEMLEKESARLQRLVQGQRGDCRQPVDVDDILRPLVVSRQAQGQSISWRPTGFRVWCPEDDLAEVLNILLDNTARHAPDATVAIYGQQSGDRVQIVVADSGPGIPPALRETLFRRGARGAGSGGDGLGLYVAHRLMIRSGGYLRLDESWHPGAAFVVGAACADRVSKGRRHDGADRVVAQ